MTHFYFGNTSVMLRFCFGKVGAAVPRGPHSEYSDSFAEQRMRRAEDIAPYQFKR